MRRACVEVFVHAVWSTWDRLPTITGAIEQDVHACIAAKVAELGGEPIAVGGTHDHVHLLAAIPATVRIADLMKHSKGASSHLANALVVGGTLFRWQGSYGAFSVSADDVRTVERYVLGQKDHHAAGSIIAPWERTTIDTP